jgi:group I intron endonuclease
MHVNKTNGKKYIGITKEPLKRRWGLNGKQYIYDNRGRFANAIKKYGWDNFEHVVVCENLSQQQACTKEIELIAAYKTQDPEYGYNIQAGGQLGNDGVTFSEESKEKMRKAKLGKKLSEEHKKKIGLSGKGRKATPKTPEGLQQLHDANIGKTIPDEVRKKISKTLTGIKRSPETLQRRKEHRKDLVKVYCPELNMTYPSIGDAARDTLVPRANIQKCLKGERHSAGRHPETNQKLHWIKVE